MSFEEVMIMVFGLEGLSSKICLAGNGINRQISLKRTGAEIISCFSSERLFKFQRHLIRAFGIVETIAMAA